MVTDTDKNKNGVRSDSISSDFQSTTYSKTLTSESEIEYEKNEETFENKIISLECLNIKI